MEKKKGLSSPSPELFMRLVKEDSILGKSLVALECLRLVAHSDILCSLLEEASSWGDSC